MRESDIDPGWVSGLRLIESPSIPKCTAYPVWSRIIGVPDLVEPGVQTVSVDVVYRMGAVVFAHPSVVTRMRRTLG
jgi:hypothetical protein